MKGLALAAMLLGAVCVASFALRAEDAPEPTLYVQIEFSSMLHGDSDAEAEAAWKSFVAEVNKLGPCVGEWKARKPHRDRESFLSREAKAMLGQPRLTSAQIATLSVEVGKLLDSPCFRSPTFSMKLSRTPIAINRHNIDAGEPKTPIPRSEWDK